jgi:starch phosphorylase
MNIEPRIKDIVGKEIKDCTNREIYNALLMIVQKEAYKNDKDEKKKKVYYISAEFLIGKLLSNNLINLGLYDQVRSLMEENGKSISDIEEIEVEPSLGNGGLGRLASCFLDSMATLNLTGAGIGLNYHFGLFQQSFEDKKQKENMNPWISNPGWLTRTEVSYPVVFKDFTIKSRMYEIAITGYRDNERTQARTNKLLLFDTDSVDESIVSDGITFDKSDIIKNLTLFLYPDDSDEKGKLLRIYQQYFMVSNAAQQIIDECQKKGSKLVDLYDYAVIQINDTHPTMIIPELIRLLIQKGIDVDNAIYVVSKTCAYTNHTILAEALEKWPLVYIEKVAPQIVPIIKLLDKKIKMKYDDEKVAIIDKNNIVHMAHIDIHFGFSVNGVAALHTQILKESELKHFYDIYPEKFNNKTNGITFRRWLLNCNPLLSGHLSKWIGNGYKNNALELEKLEKYENDHKVLNDLLNIKQKNKENLGSYLRHTQNIKIDPNSIFDVQIKRLHEYKRQQMNVLYAIYKYQQIKQGILPKRPITIIFGAKAAPAYIIAKEIIHAILCLQDIIDHDTQVSPYLKVVMVENYNVTLAEKLIPACDISEQISLASKEASGTGNMKFMLNGAVTLGTEDGANVEIHQLIGDENIYIFGASSQEVIHHYTNKDYDPQYYYDNDKTLKDAVDFITGEQMISAGDEKALNHLKKELLTKDWFMTFLDFEAYCNKKDQAFDDYENRELWAKKMLHNISMAGYFSSDRTIEEYNRDIWKLQ